MDAVLVSPYKFEVEHPHLEALDSHETETDAAQRTVEYSYKASVQKRPQPGTSVLFRFLIQHAVTPSAEKLESRTFSIDIPISATRSQDALVLRYHGTERGIDFDLVCVLQSAPVTEKMLEDGLSWTVAGAHYPLKILFRVKVALFLLERSAQQVFMCFRKEAGCFGKASLLEEAPTTGDLSLICKDGSKAPAHAAVLAGIPYFQSKLKDDWSGTEWNMHKKLDVHLPCPVDQKVVGAFLKFAYGDAASLLQLEPSEAPVLQDLFSLAESIAFTALCESVKNHVQVTEENADSWLEWLSEEHSPIARKIFRKVKRVVKRPFEDKDFWADVTEEQLAVLNKVAAKRRKTGKASKSS
ncbi:hypothetical protein KFL_000720140 [Klebsormidium nitens]|uniref:BTB domain-containing protein n=1 Tax=Klebsormidium nitens TaxID=105231 RepID=A0A1Y1HR78_KLENI|nr:hypothetical protein KFL_000720140 [Klebsormidium nitens]|eukprot:GAQ81145.1 hypothetical protein KFL_000720140 [Klebsormidium nitens]